MSGRRDMRRCQEPRWIIIALVFVVVWGGSPASKADVPGMPDWEEAWALLSDARDTVDVLVAPLRAKVHDRIALATGIGELLFWELGYQNGTAEEWRDPNSVGWLVLTDDLSDTISTRLLPLLKDYVHAHPEEILTEGRQAYELAIMNLRPPPTRMLGFHITRMGRFTHNRADSLIYSAGVTDVAGVYDGFLRLLWDWLQQYQQFHGDVLQMHMSRVAQEDWIIARLRPGCPEGTRYKVVGQYMALTLDETLYKHRFVLESKECGGQLTIEVPLPHFKEYMEEVNRLSLEEQRKLLEEKAKYR